MSIVSNKESDKIDYLAEIKEFHQRHIEPFKGKPKGCQDFEIRSLEEFFGFELPLAYKQYLAWMGKDFRGVFVGSDWFISNVKNNTAVVPELLKENEISFILPENYLCFFSHQGYIAAWFELPKSEDNPLCWFYHEGMNLKSPIVEGRFTDVLLKNMRSFAELLPRLKRIQ